MSLVTIFKAFSPPEAGINARARLEAAGFHAVVIGELAALSMEGYSNATGGIRESRCWKTKQMKRRANFLDSATDAEE